MTDHATSNNGRSGLLAMLMTAVVVGSALAVAFLFGE